MSVVMHKSGQEC